MRLTMLSGRYIVEQVNNERNCMQPEHQEQQREFPKDLHAALLGQRGGQKRMAGLSGQERSTLAKHAARARWHPREAQAIRERAEEITQIVRQALKSDPQLPLDR